MREIVARLVRKTFFFVPPPLMDALFFEIFSGWGRFRAKPFVLDKNRENYLNLGSGAHAVEGLINIDFFSTKGIDYGADLRFPLLIESGSVNGIFCEHTLEHLNYNEVDALLGECHRIMKPGSTIRIVLPDLSLFLKSYCGKNEEWFREWERLMFIDSEDPGRSRRKLLSPLGAVSFVTQEYGHVSAWDFETLKIYLEKNNFRDITRSGFRKGRCGKLLADLDSEDRRFVSMYVEAVK